MMNQILSNLETYGRWAASRVGSEAKLSAGFRLELNEFERWAAHAVETLRDQIKQKESDMSQAAVIIAKLTASVLSLQTQLKAQATTPTTSIYDAADQAAIAGFEANDPTVTLTPETEPTTGAGLLLPDGTTQQAYTTANGIQTDAAGRTLYIHTGVGGFDTNAWPLAGTVGGENVYYFTLDAKSGDQLGNGVANSWDTIAAIVPPSPVAVPPSAVVPPASTVAGAAGTDTTTGATTGTTAAAPAATPTTGS